MCLAIVELELDTLRDRAVSFDRIAGRFGKLARSSLIFSTDTKERAIAVKCDRSLFCIIA